MPLLIEQEKKDIEWYGSDAYSSKEASFLTGEVRQKSERTYTSVV